MRKHYFKTDPGAPAPLSITVERQVRFEEVDPLQIVWHGRYPSYFEDARLALGNRYGFGYQDFYRAEIPTPIRQLQIDYLGPLHFEEKFTIEARLHWCEAARINIDYLIRNQKGELVTTGCSVQMMLNRNFEVLLTPPPFYQDLLHRWRTGELQ